MDERERLFRTDIVHGALAAIPHLRTQGVALITVVLIVADIPTRVMGAHAARKHAVAGCIESFRIEPAAAIVPEPVTPLTGTPVAQHAANHQQVAARIPPPAYDPQPVADAVLHVAQHPRRVVSVGGLGRQQASGAVAFPGGARPVRRSVRANPPRKGTPGTTLVAPLAGSAIGHGRRIRLHRHAPPLPPRRRRRRGERAARYSTVTDFARLRGWSTSVPFATAT